MKVELQSKEAKEKYEEWIKDRPEALKQAWYRSTTGANNYRYIINKMLESWQKENPHLDTAAKWAESDNASAYHKAWIANNKEQLKQDYIKRYGLYKSEIWHRRAIRAYANEVFKKGQYRNNPLFQDAFNEAIENLLKRKNPYVYKKGTEAYENTDIYLSDVEQNFLNSRYKDTYKTLGDFAKSSEMQNYINEAYKKWVNEKNGYAQNKFEQSDNYIGKDVWAEYYHPIVTYYKKKLYSSSVSEELRRGLVKWHW